LRGKVKVLLLCYGLQIDMAYTTIVVQGRLLLPKAFGTVHRSERSCTMNARK